MSYPFGTPTKKDDADRIGTVMPAKRPVPEPKPVLQHPAHKPRDER